MIFDAEGNMWCRQASGLVFARKGEGPTSFCFLALGLQAFSAEFASRLRGAAVGWLIKASVRLLGAQGERARRALFTSRRVI